MAFCQNCGTEVQGSFCPNCGTQVGNAGNVPQSTVYNNVTVKARYGVGSIFLFAYFGMVFLIFGFLFFLVSLGDLFTRDFSFSLIVNSIGMLIIAAIGLLFGLPGFRSIRKNTPKELIGKTTRSFIIRSVFFLIAWAVSIVCCMFLIGLVLRAWRIGLAVSKPKDDEYTVFMNGEMIPVTRIADWEYSTPNMIRYMYVDANGTYYRPAL